MALVLGGLDVSNGFNYEKGLGVHSVWFVLV
jgi:hypothetical protein